MVVFLALINGFFLIESFAIAESLEYRIKAAFIYKFAKFLKWPAETFANDKEPLKIAVLGIGPLTAHMDTIKNNTVFGRSLIIKRYLDYKEIDAPNILVVGASEKRKLKEILNHFRNKSILTVSEIEGFGNLGGMIQLLLIEGRVRFGVNLQALKETELNLSSKVLRLAIMLPSEIHEGKK